MIKEYDIVIVGAGAGGSAAAYNLSKLGLKLLLIEQGDFIKSEDYPSWNKNWEYKKFKEFSSDPNLRNNKADYPIYYKNSDIHLANYNGIGGSTILYSGHYPRFKPSDFKIKTNENIGEDWPIDYDELYPYYIKNENLIGVSGLIGDPIYPEESFGKILEPLPIGESGKKLAKSFNDLNWHWWPSYSAIISRSHDGREKCINIGTCNAGCPQDAKSSADNTYIRKAINNIEIITNCRVVDINIKDDKVRGLEYINLNNNKSTSIKSKIIILAASGVGTPKILLTSNSYQGISNSSGLVGKNLMLHPLGYVEGKFNEDLKSNSGPQGCMIFSHEFSSSPNSNSHKRGFTIQALKGSGQIETVINGINRRSYKIGNNINDYLSEHFNKTIGLGLIVEDLPEESNQIKLSDELYDSSGYKSIEVTYKVSENSKKIMNFALKKGIELMNNAGAEKVYSAGPVKNTGWHILGTTKMGDDPKNSVVNKFGESHDINNLYIFDGSVFPTSSSVNPANTIQSLSLFFSEKLKERIIENNIDNSSSKL